jgi:hypothetical protein
MNKYTEQQIEDQLKQLASIQPGEESLRRMNRNIRSIISGAGEKSRASYRFLYYVAASAAVLLIGIGLLYDTRPVEKPSKIVGQMLTEPTPTLVKLNAVFQSGGQQALNEYLEIIESSRQPRAETITLQEIMKDL